MNGRCFQVVSAIVCLGALAGCKKKESGLESSPGAQQPPATDRVAGIHWAGKKRVMSDTNFTSLAEIWLLPEAARLEAQTLDKLALAPWRQITDVTRWLRVTNYASLVQEHPQARLLRPLLQEAIEEETRFEIWRGTNQPTECAVGTRLAASRAAAWETNLAAIRQGLPGLTVQIASTNGWTIVGWSELAANRAYNRLLADIRTQRKAESRSNELASVLIDLQHLAGPLLKNERISTNLPLVSLTVTGDGQNLRTRGTAECKFAPPLQLDTWLAPTNLIKGPISSFTAFRGFRPFLEGNSWLKYYLFDPVPNQLFSWSMPISGSHFFTAFPRPGVGFWLQTSGPDVPSKSLAWLTNYARGLIEYNKEHNGLAWRPMPMFAPILEAKQDASSEYLLFRTGGPLPPVGRKPPEELFLKLTNNVVYYDWEVTEQKVTQWFLLAQSLRMTFWHQQIWRDSPSTKFLVAAAPKLRPTATEITRSSDTTFAIARRSDTGFTAVELHILADWLESPDFPKGFHTFMAPEMPKGQILPPGMKPRVQAK